MTAGDEFTREFGAHAKLPVALAALRSADPVGTLGGAFHWVPEVERQRFVDEATPFDNIGDRDNLQAAGERFLHGAIASKPELERLPVWARDQVVVLILTFLVAAALVAAVVAAR